MVFLKGSFWTKVSLQRNLQVEPTKLQAEQKELLSWDVLRWKPRGCSSVHRSLFWRGLAWMGDGPSARHPRGLDLLERKKWPQKIVSQIVFFLSVRNTMGSQSVERNTHNDQIQHIAMQSMLSHQVYCSLLLSLLCLIPRKSNHPFFNHH